MINHSAADVKRGNPSARRDFPPGVDRFARPRLEEKIGTPKPNRRGESGGFGLFDQGSWRTTTTIAGIADVEGRRSASRS